MTAERRTEARLNRNGPRGLRRLAGEDRTPPKSAGAVKDLAGGPCDVTARGAALPHPETAKGGADRLTPALPVVREAGSGLFASRDPLTELLADLLVLKYRDVARATANSPTGVDRGDDVTRPGA